MSRRLALALATLIVGAGLLAAAAFGSGASTPLVLKLGTAGGLGPVDPALSYGTTAWGLETATAARLLRNADVGGSPIPEVAKRFTVSKNGRVYRFVLRRTYRFSDGEPVRAASFAYAIKRALNPALGSPGGAFVSDPKAVDIVGAKPYAAGRATTISGVRAAGLTLTIKLVRADPGLLQVLTLPFFQAASSKLSLTHETTTVRQVGDLPTAGPYTWSHIEPSQQADLARNPYYSGTRGRHVDGVELDMWLNAELCFQRTQASELDLGCLPPAEVADVARQNGVSRTKPVGTGRFWVKSSGCESTLLFNFRRSLFAGNTPLRQAVNWALDRTALAGQLAPYSTGPWTHVVPPGFPGVVTARGLQPYSLRADFVKARQLAAGHMGDGTIKVAYQSAGHVGPLQAEAVRQALVGLGFDSSKVEMHGFAGFDLYQAVGTRGAPYDVVVGLGFCPDSLDPAPFIAYALGRVGLGDFSPDSKAYNRAFDLLSRKLKGAARTRALGRFDVQLMKNLAPIAVLSVGNQFSFFSDRVDPASLAYAPVFGWSLTALRLK